MTLFIFFALAAPISPQSEVAFFNDDVIEQSEASCCGVPDECQERELFSQISPESRRLYNSMDCKGKVRALELAQKAKDKDCAIEQAACEMAQRQGDEYPFQENYERQLEKRANQVPYNRRYGY